MRRLSTEKVPNSPSEDRVNAVPAKVRTALLCRYGSKIILINRVKAKKLFLKTK